MQIRLVPQELFATLMKVSNYTVRIGFVELSNTANHIGNISCQHINTEDVDTIYFNEKSDFCCFSIMV